MYLLNCLKMKLNFTTGKCIKMFVVTIRSLCGKLTKVTMHNVKCDTF